jgi:flagellar hook protein FlgE
MDVIGANIANVNTIGFKGSRVTFRDVLYQSIGSATMPSEEDPIRGGTNPTQIGLGVQIASIDVLNTRAGPMTTDKPTDVYINGEGYFGVYNPGDQQIYYTRVGDLRFDTRGNLLDGLGNFVLGYRLEAPIPIGEIEDFMGWTVEVE